MKKVTFVRNNNLYLEPRLIKIYESIKDNYDCSFITWGKVKDNKKYLNNYSLNKIVNYGSLKVLLYLPIWWIFCIRMLFKLKPDIIHACDFESAFPAYIYSKFKKTKIVYDLWDAVSFRVPASLKPIVSFAAWSERWLMKKVAVVLLFDVERFEQLKVKQEDLTTPSYIIYNSLPAPKKKVEINLINNRIKIAYVGVLIKDVRGLEQILEAAKEFSKIDFEIYGYGPDQDYFKSVFTNSKLKNINFHGRVDTKKSLEINKSADILISLLDPSVENFRYATSSKVYEAFSLSKPIITTDKTASGRLVKEANWGVVIPYGIDYLTKALKDIQTGKIVFNLDPKKVEKYSWENMEKELAMIYSELIG